MCHFSTLLTTTFMADLQFLNNTHVSQFKKTPFVIVAVITWKPGGCLESLCCQIAAGDNKE